MYVYRQFLQSVSNLNHTSSRATEMVSLCKEGTQCPVLRGKEDGACDVKARLYSALRSYFKFDEFRPGQLESLVPLLHGKDVFIRLATGSGKSLCMFLAPLASSGCAMAVIVSPLNGLMDEQVSLFKGLDGGIDPCFC